jgi:hypothetical protein
MRLITPLVEWWRKPRYRDGVNPDPPQGPRPALPPNPPLFPQITLPEVNLRIVRRKVLYKNELGTPVWTGEIREVLQHAQRAYREGLYGAHVDSGVTEWRDVPIEDERT